MNKQSPEETESLFLECVGQNAACISHHMETANIRNLWSQITKAAIALAEIEAETSFLWEDSPILWDDLCAFIATYITESEECEETELAKYIRTKLELEPNKK